MTFCVTGDRVFGARRPDCFRVIRLSQMRLISREQRGLVASISSAISHRSSRALGMLVPYLCVILTSVNSGQPPSCECGAFGSTRPIKNLIDVVCLATDRNQWAVLSGGRSPRWFHLRVRLGCSGTGPLSFERRKNSALAFSSSSPPRYMHSLRAASDACENHFSEYAVIVLPFSVSVPSI